LPFLKENFPQLVPEYEQRFKERAFLPAAYRKRISELFARLRRKYGITNSSGWEARAPKASEEMQMKLF
jgi:hypothetical protein